MTERERFENYIKLLQQEITTEEIKKIIADIIQTMINKNII